MSRRLENKGGGLARAALLSFLIIGSALAGGTAGAEPAEGSLRFDQVFLGNDERGPMHFRAIFLSRNTEHKLEVWRDGPTRLKRVTDADVETFVMRRPGDAEFEMTVLDMRRKILTRIDRTNLYRIGNLTDWFDLAHALRHPKGAYRLARAQAPQGTAKSVEPCSWYTLTQEEQTSHVCWSARRQLPMTIVSQTGQLLWRVTELDQRTIPAQVFVVHDRGFVRNDANQDIERD